MTVANDNIPNSANDFYVYTWTRPDTEQVFYVGKGRGPRSKNTSRRNKHFLNIINKLATLGMDPIVTHVKDGLFEDEAFELEISLISKYGRIKDGGTLCNMTFGGEGRSGSVNSEESKRKQSASVRKTLSDPKIRKKISLRLIERYKDPAVRIAHGAMVSARYLDPAAREKTSASLKGIPKSPEHVKRVSEVLTASWSRNLKRRENHRGLTLMKGPRSNNKSGYKGVSFDASTGKWLAQIEVEKRTKHLGRYTDPAEAARAYDEGAIRYYGREVYLNFAQAAANDNNEPKNDAA